MRTLPPLVAWMLVWGTGWALFFVNPVSSSSLGALLLLAASFVALISAWPRRDPPGRGTAILLIVLVFFFLLLVFVLPPSYRWQFPTDALLQAALKGFGVFVAVFGVAVNWRRFVRGSVEAR